MSPLEKYQKEITIGNFFSDDAQLLAVRQLDQVWHAVIDADQQSKSFLGRFKKYKAPRGLYMWGGVGRGKTWLMDQFFENLPIKRKVRIHFHHFMQQVHRDLIKYAGQKNPLDQVAKDIHQDALIICFDEFFVSNVTDAMILSDLFQKLFQLGITLIATSNIEPDGLYKDGIHRDRFLPTIKMVKTYCDVLNVDAGIDYRLRLLKQAQLFKSPLNVESHQWLENLFINLTNNQIVNKKPIEVNHRTISVYGYTSDILWCDFDVLCRQPRSPSDFIELAAQYSTVLIENVPHLTDQLNDITRRFIYLVDEFYDQKVKLVLTSQDSIIEIYKGERLAFEIERTRSRLLEMQSDDYLNS